MVALPPSGLRDCYARLLGRTPDAITIALHDSPENILKRVKFYDDNSKLIEREMNSRERKVCLREIKKDVVFFNKSYRRADYHVDITDLDVGASVRRLVELLS